MCINLSTVYSNNYLQWEKTSPLSLRHRLTWLIERANTGQPPASGGQTRYTYTVRISLYFVQMNSVEVKSRVLAAAVTAAVYRDICWHMHTG